MRHDARGDLVSMTAIVAGAVVSVVVTIASMIMSGDETPNATPGMIDRCDAGSVHTAEAVVAEERFVEAESAGALSRAEIERCR